MSFKTKMRWGLFALVLVALVGAVVMMLWNWLMPVLFGLPVIGYWQALGLLLLSKILFSGFGKKGHHSHKYWRSRFRQKWQNMSEEEREKYRQCWPGKEASKPATE